MTVLPLKSHTGRTVRDAFDALLERLEFTRQLSNRRQAEYLLRVFEPLMAHRVADLTPSQIHGVLRRIETDPSPRTGRPRVPQYVQQLTSWLRRALDLAVEQGHLERSPMPPPIRLLPDMDADPIRNDECRFTSEEAGALMYDPRIPGLRRALYAYAFCTGARPGELLEIRLGDHRTDHVGDLYWPITRQYQSQERKVCATKTRQSRAVPLTEQLLEAHGRLVEHVWPRLARRPIVEGDLLFPSFRNKGPTGHASTDTFLKWIRRDCDALGIRSRPFKATRATFISILTVDHERSELVVRFMTHKNATESPGGRVFGTYARGRYDKCKRILQENLQYPREGRAQLAFSFYDSEIR